MLLVPLILFLGHTRFCKFFQWNVKDIFVIRALINNDFIWDLGYANEVGESFRQLVSVKHVRLSYIIASTYCLADATSKAKKIVSNKSCPH